MTGRRPEPGLDDVGAPRPLTQPLRACDRPPVLGAAPASAP